MEFFVRCSKQGREYYRFYLIEDKWGDLLLYDSLVNESRKLHLEELSHINNWCLHKYKDGYIYESIDKEYFELGIYSSVLDEEYLKEYRECNILKEDIDRSLSWELK